MDLFDEYALIGAAIISAQKFEFGLYGVVAHLSHLPEAQKDRRFRNLTPELFLRGGIEGLKATLGQLEEIFGEKLLITTNEIREFIKDRNLIAHNYWRLTKSNIKNGNNLINPEKFLNEFISRCEKLINIINGLVLTLMKESAKKEGRLAEIEFSEKQLNDISAYEENSYISFIENTNKKI